MKEISVKVFDLGFDIPKKLAVESIVDDSQFAEVCF
jgi:hypothetical protein